ncbi:MAG: response regulator [Chloroflexota bacterium]|nr:response regulator [Chloroflexota bacterium]
MPTRGTDQTDREMARQRVDRGTTPATYPFLVQETRILIAEDNPTAARLLETILGEYGRIYIATDGLEALEMARPTKPHLILSDIHMPRMSGIELCQHLKSDPETSSIPIILLSATDQPNRTECNAQAFLMKPFPIDELQRTVRELLNRTDNT